MGSTEAAAAGAALKAREMVLARGNKRCEAKDGDEEDKDFLDEDQRERRTAPAISRREKMAKFLALAITEEDHLRLVYSVVCTVMPCTLGFGEDFVNL